MKYKLLNLTNTNRPQAHPQSRTIAAAGGVNMYTRRDEWSDLAEAIILKAVDDYRHTSKRLQAKPNDDRLKLQKAEIEKFFLSSWFQVLTDLDGKQLLQKLQAEIQQRKDMA